MNMGWSYERDYVQKVARVRLSWYIWDACSSLFGLLMAANTDVIF